ncbi:hypothetical protein DH09_17840 [Bacillaceae bacterium JMAK1]|nr:hypothetical protein DH09_17840 [Bacillaceae bacterium JMAK1]
MYITESTQPILIALLVIYALVILLYSYYFYRKTKTYESYNMGGRAMPLIPMVLTIIGAAVGGSTVLGFMTDAYQFGLGQVWLVVSLALALSIFTLFFAKRIRVLGDKHKLFSVGDYAVLRYGSAARYPAFIGNIAALGALTGLQFVALATVLNLIFGLDMTAGIIISCIVITLKTYLGGLTAVIWTDAIQGTIQTLGILTMFIFVYYLTGGWDNVVSNVETNATISNDFLLMFNMPLAEFLMPFMTIGAAMLVRQDTWQRVWAARNLSTTLKANWIAVILMFLTGLMIIVIGVMARAGLGIETDRPDLIYYDVIFGALPFWLSALMFITLVAIIMSCADSFFIAGSTIMVSDIIKPVFKITDDKKLLYVSRLMVIAMAIFSLCLALLIPRLVELWMTGSAILVAGLFAPILIGMFWTRPDKVAGLASMWTGLILTVSWQLLGHPFGIHPVFIGLPLSLLVLLILSFRKKAM